MLSSTLVTAFALFSTTGWAGYVLQDDYLAQGFFDQFSFFEGEDPTHGFVAYQNRQAATSAQLINQTSSQITMGVDSTSSNVPNGRPSVRITSNKSYNSGLVIADIEHMPGGICGTWPAFWMVGPNWPNGGEIDILEGVNDQTANDVTLHTGPGCSVTDTSKTFSGKMTYSTCASSWDNNNGCQIASSDSNSYGAGFNANGGGVYAMEWTGSYISVHFFPRGSIPADISNGAPNPESWGLPLAKFAGGCDMSTAFVEQQIVFDTTFCGDWAGKVWGQGSCASKASTCEAYVQNNPQAFAEAYWTVNGLKVYQNNGDSTAQSTVIATSTSIQYITQPTVAPTPTTMIVATSSSAGYVPVVGPSGIVGGGSSPAETGTTGGYAPVVGGDGTVNGAAPAETGGEFSWSTGPDGEAVFGGKKRDEVVREKHAKHLRHHRRHGGKF